MSKHSNSDSEDSNSATLAEPRSKRRKIVEFEPVRICSISGVKDIDNKVLRAQHYKLCERYRYKEKQRLQLERRVEELEGRQAKDDEVSCIINRHWNRLDEDVQLLLQRFNADASVDYDNSNEGSDERKNFLTILSNWGTEEVDEKLEQRVEFTRRALAKLVQIFDKVAERNQRLLTLLAGDKEAIGRTPSPKGNDSSADDEPLKAENLGDELKSYATSALAENTKLQRMLTQMQAENHRLKIKSTGKDDRVSIMENRIETLTTEVEEARFDLDKALQRCEKLDYRLAEYIRKEQLQVSVAAAEKSAKANGAAAEDELANVSKSKLSELQCQLDVQTEMAANRLIELQEMTERNKHLSADLERCQMELKYVSGDVVKSSSEYAALQAQYSALFDDCKLLRNEVEELRQRIVTMTQTHAKEVENMKNEEAAAQDRMQETVLDLDNQLNQMRKEYEALCMEFERSNAANEQAGPINEHALSLMNTFSTQNTQLRADVSRYKRRWSDTAKNLTKCQKELASERKINNEKYLIVKLDDSRNGSSRRSQNSHGEAESADLIDRKPLLADGTANGSDPAHHNTKDLSTSSDTKEAKSEPMDGVEGTSEDVKPSCSISERRLKLERDSALEKLREMGRAERREKLKFYTDEAKRKIHSLEEQCEKLRKELANAKQEEDGLMTELDSTGQACDEMQEQNRKLVLQLREKDEANLKLMAERIRANQLLKKMKEERDTLEAKSTAVDNLLAAKMLLIKKLEDKERALMENRTTLEQELRLRDQAGDSLKRKAAESAQSANDMRLRLDKLTTQFSEVQESVAKKASSYEVIIMKTKRLEEEKSNLKRKLERAKRMEKFDNADAVLTEENRLLKESLTCPSCKVNKKNAILTKCYHVFCFQCLKLRYDTRRRKCPKCNAGFGSNDFRRVYIECLIDRFVFDASTTELGMTAKCDYDENELQLSNAWRDRSFFLEMKPRTEFASLFMDCCVGPSSADTKRFVKVETNSLAIHCDSEAGSGANFKARIADIHMSPNSVCGPSWADVQRRLFMCKVRIDGEDGVFFPRKSFRDFEESLSSRLPIGECVDEMLHAFDEMRVLCRECHCLLHSYAKRDVDFDVLPEDDWLDTSPGMEYFCGQSCGHGCSGSSETAHHHIVDHPPRHQRHHPHAYYDGLLGISSLTGSSTNAADRWLPTASKLMFSNSFLLLFANNMLKQRVEHVERVLKCRKCTAQLGVPLRVNDNVFKLHVGAVEIFGSGGDLSDDMAAGDGEVLRDYIISRFVSFERYFAWMFLYKSESQSSMKLLIRTYDRRASLLVWLMEPYVVMANGTLQRVRHDEEPSNGDENQPPRSVKERTNEADEQLEEFRPFSALKILYKIYDEQSAANDPRANGGDSSIGIVDIPHSCCLKLAEILLRSSHSMPPTLRAVGQLFVGYLCLNESAE